MIWPRIPLILCLRPPEPGDGCRGLPPLTPPVPLAHSSATSSSSPASPPPPAPRPPVAAQLLPFEPGQHRFDPAGRFGRWGRGQGLPEAAPPGGHSSLRNSFDAASRTAYVSESRSAIKWSTLGLASTAPAAGLELARAVATAVSGAATQALRARYALAASGDARSAQADACRFSVGATAGLWGRGGIFRQRRWCPRRRR